MRDIILVVVTVLDEQRPHLPELFTRVRLEQRRQFRKYLGEKYIVVRVEEAGQGKEGGRKWLG